MPSDTRTLNNIVAGDFNGPDEVASLTSSSGIYSHVPVDRIQYLDTLGSTYCYYHQLSKSGVSQSNEVGTGNESSMKTRCGIYGSTPCLVGNKIDSSTHYHTVYAEYSTGYAAGGADFGSLSAAHTYGCFYTIDVQPDATGYMSGSSTHCRSIKHEYILSR